MESIHQNKRAAQSIRKDNYDFQEAIMSGKDWFALTSAGQANEISVNFESVEAGVWMYPVCIGCQRGRGSRNLGGLSIKATVSTCTPLTQHGS